MTIKDRLVISKSAICMGEEMISKGNSAKRYGLTLRIDFASACILRSSEPSGSLDGEPSLDLLYDVARIKPGSPVSVPKSLFECDSLIAEAESWVSYEVTDDREECEENETLEVGGECGDGTGVCVRSIFAVGCTLVTILLLYAPRWIVWSSST
jgi:hypothetical protein